MWSAPLGRHVWAGATVVTLLAASRVAGESSVPVAAAPIPDINVWLETNWQAPPILLELLETAYIEDPTIYFPLLTLAAHSIPYLQSPSGGVSTPEQQYNAFNLLLIESPLLTAAAAGQQQQQQHPTFDLSSFAASVSLHVASPKIAAYHQYYATAVNETRAGSGIGRICDEWVEWRGKGFCGVDELKQDLESALEEGKNESLGDKPHLLPFDHIYKRAGGSSRIDFIPPILYISDLTPQFADLYLYLLGHTRVDPDFQFVVRYRPTDARRQEAPKTSVKGYGVEMVLKKTDYLVVDDREDGGNTSGQTSSSSRPVAAAAAGQSASSDEYFKDVLSDDPLSELAHPLRPSELSGLGAQAVSLIQSSPDPLSALVHLSQDFPRYSAALARRTPFNQDAILEVQTNQMNARLGDSVWINGRNLKSTDMDAFRLLDIIREERSRMIELTSLGLTPEQAFELLTNEGIGEAQLQEEPLAGLVDASDRSEGGSVIIWWNNIEKDKKYSTWSSSINGLLRPTQPGAFQNVKRNLWNVVLVLDMTQRSTYGVIAQQVRGLIQRGLPLRFGLVPMVDESNETSIQLARLLQYSVTKLGRAMTMDWMQAVYASTVRIDVATIRQLWTDIRETSDKEIATFDEIVSNSDNDLADVKAYLKRVAATRDDSLHGHFFLNGKHRPFNEMWTQILMQDYTSQLSHIVQPEVARQVKQLKDLNHYFYDLPTTLKRRNPYIVPGGPMSPLILKTPSGVFPRDSILTRQFLQSADAAPTDTIWLFGDLDNPSNVRLILNALQTISGMDARLGLVHRSVGVTQATPRVSTALYHLLSTSSLSSTSLSDLESFLKGDTALTDGSPLQTLGANGFSESDSKAAKRFWESSGVELPVEIENDSALLMVNGRIIPVVHASDFEADDLAALIRFEHQKRTQPVITALNTIYQDVSAFSRDGFADLVLGATAVLGKAYAASDFDALSGSPETIRTRAYEHLRDTHTQIRQGVSDTSLVRLFAVLNPLSEAAQKWSAIFKFVAGLDHASVQIQLNPDLALTEMPLKRFYRYEATPQLRFDVDGEEATTGCSFHQLPGEPIFTLGMDLPTSWLASPRNSVYDLDNLRLDAIAKRSSATAVDFHFEIDQLVVEGHAREPSNQPPRGLQLQLQSLDGETLGDTQIMANLGYFQFKTNPGVTTVQIRPGRGRDIYRLESMSDSSGSVASVEGGAAELSVTSFGGVTILPIFARLPGMQVADVLDESTPKTPGGILNKLVTSLSTWVGKTPAKTQAEINIFTVASGLLYERFASIMILSVLKHTKSRVKFWFIKNFLSPSFLEFIPAFAEEYGFDYELVTYQWPSWLNGQKEKQREIWGYKILFLDVLFPMNLDKVIFVDADQIVRTDLKELVDLDLQGRVYGYAPMGDDKPEMEGFRFWKQGYWRDALRGRPYHISALYVVDLKRFRQQAAGDRLRAQYQGLSRDPNSLANLDQDLPNSMQDQLPIYTLDRSWLWCETWCSQESLAEAKTIDLCQNPLTKEPKLARARAIPEWDTYDQEVAEFARRLSEKRASSSSSTGFVQDVDVLAAPGAVPEEEEKDTATGTQGTAVGEEPVRITDEL